MCRFPKGIEFGFLHFIAWRLKSRSDIKPVENEPFGMDK